MTFFKGFLLQSARGCCWLDGTARNVDFEVQGEEPFAEAGFFTRSGSRGL